MSAMEKRLGKRQSTPDIRIGWRIDRETRRGLRMKPDPQEGVIIDISVTGAGVLAPASDELRPGSRVRISFDSHEGTVSVRRIAPTSDPAVSRYGVTFEEGHGPLIDAVNRYLAGGRPDTLDRFWNQAT